MLDRNYRGRIEDPASRRVRKTRRASLTTWPLPRWSRRAIAFVRGNSNQELSLGLSEIAMRIVFSLHIECPGNHSTIDKGVILRGKVNRKYGVTFFHTNLRCICELAWLITELSLCHYQNIINNRIWKWRGYSTCQNQKHRISFQKKCYSPLPTHFHTKNRPPTVTDCIMTNGAPCIYFLPLPIWIRFVLLRTFLCSLQRVCCWIKTWRCRLQGKGGERWRWWDAVVWFI